MTEDDYGIGRRIRERRLALQMTQEELALKVGYKTRASINQIELNARNLTQSRIMVFAKALKTTPSYIMGWDEEKPNVQWFEKSVGTVAQDMSGMTVELINPKHQKALDKYAELFEKLDSDDKEEIMSIMEMKLKKSKYN